MTVSSAGCVCRTLHAGFAWCLDRLGRVGRAAAICHYIEEKSIDVYEKQQRDWYLRYARSVYIPGREITVRSR